MLMVKRQFQYTHWRSPKQSIKNISVFWDITLCSLSKVNERFGEIYYFSLQGWRVRRAKKLAWNFVLYLLHSCFLLGLFFKPEDEDHFIPPKHQLTVNGLMSIYSSPEWYSHMHFLPQFVKKTIKLFYEITVVTIFILHVIKEVIAIDENFMQQIFHTHLHVYDVAPLTYWTHDRWAIIA
jgi:hypothetical protein